jgi:serine/threonine-protein kinase RsbW
MPTPPRLVKLPLPDFHERNPSDDSVAELSISANGAELQRASAWLEATGREHSVPAEQIRRLDQCLNEALANIIAHGGPTAESSPVHLVLHMQRRPSAAELTISDAGVAFDPLAFQPKSRPQTLSEVEPGGLGLMMMRDFSDSMSYCYKEGRNRLTFTVSWTEAE